MCVGRTGRKMREEVWPLARASFASLRFLHERPCPRGAAPPRARLGPRPRYRVSPSHQVHEHVHGGQRSPGDGHGGGPKVREEREKPTTPSPMPSRKKGVGTRRACVWCTCDTPLGARRLPGRWSEKRREKEAPARPQTTPALSLNLALTARFSLPKTKIPGLRRGRRLRRRLPVHGRPAGAVRRRSRLQHAPGGAGMRERGEVERESRSPVRPHLCRSLFSLCLPASREADARHPRRL